MKYAKLKLDPADKQKFEIISTGKGSGSVRYHLRANHPVEANRWIFALTQAIQAATAESVSVNTDDGASMHSRSVSTSERPAPAARSTSSLDLRQKMSNMSNSSAVSINTEDDSDEYPPEDGDEPHKGDFEATAHSAQVQLEILEKLLGSLPQGDHQRLRTEGGQETPAIEDPVLILKKTASSLHGTLDELVRMSQTRDNYWRAQLDREKELRRLWEENMESLAEEQEHMEEAMNNAIEQRRMTKRALRAMSIAVQQPDKGAEYIRRLSVSERDHPSNIPPEDIAPPEAIAAVISSSEDEDDEFFDAIGSEVSTLAEEPPKPPEKAITSKPKSTKEQELQLSMHGYEVPYRTKFEKLDKDNRPKISLWGILKSMVGKDMTKMVRLPSSHLISDITCEFQ
jgi:oxysterol-binding protein 1